MNLYFEGIGIAGISAAVPPKIIDNLEPKDNFSPEETKRFVESTGIRFRRHTETGTCSSDLCFAAAEKLIEEMDIDRLDIQALIFVSHTPDYRRPATSIILQDRLGLKNAFALDINLGCSGFIYGLYTAFSFINSSQVNNILLLNGETLSKSYSLRDKSSGLLFGDAGAATLIKRDSNFGKSWFSLFSDGSRHHLIKAQAGGYRKQSSIETVEERLYPDGSIRSEEQGIMDGAGIFTFILSDVYRDINGLLDFAKFDVDQIDYFVLHQANHFALEHLRKKLKIPADKVPISLNQFGNTSGPSIPLTVTSCLNNIIKEQSKKIMFSGFGVGLSWGSAIMEVGPVYVGELITDI
jgi:3-oxoacyl-[acyl-carrier-protein] synthase III